MPKGSPPDFMRVCSERFDGIPPEQVIGTTARTRFERRNDRSGRRLAGYATAGNSQPAAGIRNPCRRAVFTSSLE